MNERLRSLQARHLPILLDAMSSMADKDRLLAEAEDRWPQIEYLSQLISGSPMQWFAPFLDRPTLTNVVDCMIAELDRVLDILPPDEETSGVEEAIELIEHAVAQRTALLKRLREDLTPKRGRPPLSHQQECARYIAATMADQLERSGVPSEEVFRKIAGTGILGEHSVEAQKKQLRRFRNWVADQRR